MKKKVDKALDSEELFNGEAEKWSLSYVVSLIRGFIGSLKFLPKKFSPEYFAVISVDGGDGKDYVHFSHSDDLQKIGNILFEVMKKRPDLAETIITATAIYISGEIQGTQPLKQTLA